MKREAIPDQTRHWADEVVREFNERVIRDPNRYFTVRYRGSYLYVDRFESGVASPVCRLTYTGSIDQWDFAIFKYSTERYDPGEWFFPGSGYADGTMQGSLRAALEAYP